MGTTQLETVPEPKYWHLKNVLTEALRSAGDDFSLISEAQAHASAPPMMFRRAELRCELAIALFEYRQEFGFPESANEVEAESVGGGS